MVPRPVHVATLGAAHGVKGELRVKSLTADPAAFASYGPFSTERGEAALVLAACRTLRKDLFLVRFRGIEDRNGAARIAGCKLFVPRDRLPALSAEEFYWTDLIGLAAHTPAGAPLGAVVGVENYGAGDILVVRLSGGETILLPFTKAVVPVIDLASGALVIVPPVDVEITLAEAQNGASP